jgi:hypothetical protein
MSRFYSPIIHSHPKKCEFGPKKCELTQKPNFFEFLPKPKKLEKFGFYPKPITKHFEFVPKSPKNLGLGFGCIPEPQSSIQKIFRKIIR